MSNDKIMAEVNRSSLGSNPFTTISNVTIGSMMVACFLVGVFTGHKMRKSIKTLASIALVGRTKMALVIREDLKMGKGKIASQCCHATLEAYKKLAVTNPLIIQAWETIGQPKVVLKVLNKDELDEIAQVAASFKVQTVLIRDAGKTQIEPGSATVLAVGPATVASMDKVTGHLKLL